MYLDADISSQAGIRPLFSEDCEISGEQEKERWRANGVVSGREYLVRTREERESKIKGSVRRGVYSKGRPVQRRVGQKQEELDREDGVGEVVGVKRF